MRIDGPNRLNATPAGEPDRQAVRRPANGQAGAADGGDAMVSSPALRRYVDQARGCEEMDLQAVAEARRLIEAGELDTPEAIQRAAERIMSQGL